MGRPGRSHRRVDDGDDGFSGDGDADERTDEETLTPTGGTGPGVGVLEALAAGMVGAGLRWWFGGSDS